MMTTADTFATAIDIINKADEFTGMIPYCVILNIKEHTLINLTEEFKHKIVELLHYGLFVQTDHEIQFMIQILLDVMEMLTCVTDKFGNRILGNDKNIVLEISDILHPKITWDIVRAHTCLEYDYSAISLHSNITLDIVQANPNEEWNYYDIV